MEKSNSFTAFKTAEEESIREKIRALSNNPKFDFITKCPYLLTFTFDNVRKESMLIEELSPLCLVFFIEHKEERRRLVIVKKWLMVFLKPLGCK